jgi:hypothetical protein
MVESLNFWRENWFDIFCESGSVSGSLAEKLWDF